MKPTPRRFSVGGWRYDDTFERFRWEHLFTWYAAARGARYPLAKARRHFEQRYSCPIRLCGIDDKPKRAPRRARKAVAK